MHKPQEKKGSVFWAIFSITALGFIFGGLVAVFSPMVFWVCVALLVTFCIAYMAGKVLF